MSGTQGNTGAARRILSVLALLLVVVLPLMNVAVQTRTVAAAGNPTMGLAGQPAGTVPILVQFRANASQAATAAAIQAGGGQDARNLSQIHTHIINVPAASASQIVAAYSHQPAVAHAAQAVTLTKASTPNDPNYSQQWALPQIGWDQAYGTVNPSGSAKIAVLDTGVDATHPDLSGQMTAGVSEIGGDPNSDPNGHGTEMAGIAAASVNNNTGIAGVDYAGASIESVQVLGADGTGTDAAVSAGVIDAADAGANVILMGFSSQTPSSTLANAVSYAQGKGVVVVAATGNGGSTAASYPAGLPGVIGVAATDQNDNLTSYSNTGSAAVAAPGEGILSTQAGGGYGTVSGTSPASAEVAGLAGLLIANGDNASQVASQVIGTADSISGASFGRIDVAMALGASSQPTSTATNTPQPTDTPQTSPTDTPQPPATDTPGPTSTAAPSASPTPTSGYQVASADTFNGTIYSGSGTGTPVSGATLTCSTGCNNAGQGTTNSSGTIGVTQGSKFSSGYTVQYAGTGNISFCVQKSGFLTQTIGVNPGNGNNTYNADFHLTPVAVGSEGSCNQTTTPTKLAIITSAQSITAGQKSAVMTVQEQDAGGNAIIATSAVTVTLSSDSTGTKTFYNGSGTSLSTPAQVTIAAGATSANFFYSDTKASASYTTTPVPPTITAAASGLTSATQQETITAATASQLVVSTIASTSSGATLGGTSGVTATVEDQYGNVVTGNTDTISIAIKSGTGNSSATLSGITSKAALAGVATFSNLSIDKTGSNYQLTAADSTLSLTKDSNLFNITAATATHYLVTSSNYNPVAGTSVTITAQLADGSGNSVATSGKVITWSSTNGGSFGTPTSTTDSNGQATVTFTTNTTAGTIHVVTATDNSSPTNLTGTSPAITTVAGAASKLAITSVNGGSSPTAGTGFGVVVQAQDSNGNAANVSANTGISLSLKTGSGTLGGTLTGTINAGSNSTTISGVTYSRAQTGVVITATRTSGDTLTPGDSAPFTVVAGALDHFGVTAPGTVTAGTAFPVTVTAFDAQGNVVTGYTGTTTFTLSTVDGGAGGLGNYTFTATDKGSHTFSVTLTKATTSQTITASDTSNSLITGTSDNITVSVGAADAGQSTVVANPTSVVADGSTSSTITVTLKDGSDNPIGGKSVSLSAGSGSSTITIVSGTTGSNGQATFTVTDSTAESVTYNATDASDSNLAITQTATVTFTPGPATHFLVSAPSSATAGSAFDVTVTALDVKGNVATGYTGKVTFSSSDTGSQTVLPGDYQFTAADKGVHTFSNGVTLTTAGSQTVTATDMGTWAITGTASVNVSAGSADHLAFDQQPTDTVSGASITPAPTVRILDAYGNLTDSTATVTVAIGTNPSSGTLSGTTSHAAVAGVATFSGLSIDKAGSGYTLSAGSGSLTGATSNGFAITAGAATHFSVSAPTSATAGMAIIVTVTALDANGNTATGYTGSFTFSSSDRNATLPSGDQTLANGTGQFSVTLKTAGKQTVTATDTTDSTIKGTSNDIDVSPAAVNAGQSTVVANPASVVADGSATSTITVTLEDAYGNAVSGKSVTLAKNSGASASIVTVTGTTDSSGQATFTTTDTKAEVVTYTATDADDSTTLTQTPQVTFTPGPATHFDVSGYQSPTTAGDAHDVTVTALDANGNTATGYDGTFTLRTTDSSATLPSGAASLSLTNGTGQFSVTFVTAATQSITAADNTTSTITGQQTGIVVNPAPASEFVWTNYPTNDTVTAGSSFGLTLTAEDQFGNRDTNYTGTVSFTTTDPYEPKGLPGDYTFTTGSGQDNGTHTFDTGFTLYTVGTTGYQTITAADSVNKISQTTDHITVNPAGLDHFGVSTPGTSPTAGAEFSETVTAYDAYGNVATGYNGPAGLSDTSGTLSVSQTGSFTNGVWTGDVIVTKAGDDVITAADNSHTGQSNSFTVNPAAVDADHSTIVADPTSVVADGSTTSTITVTLKDLYDNVVSGKNVTLSSDSTKANISPNTAAQTDSNGQAAFTTTDTKAQVVTYTAEDSDDSTTLSHTAQVTFTPGPATHFDVEGFQSPTTAGDQHTVTVTALDQFDNVATGYRGTAHFTSSDGQAVLPDDYPFTASDAGAQIFNATLKTAGLQTITATDTNAPSITGMQSDIQVNPAAASHLVWSDVPTSTTAGSSFSPTLTAKDPYGNVDTNYTGTVSFTTTDPYMPKGLPVDYTFTTGSGQDNGVHTFTGGFTLYTVGDNGYQTITAADSANKISQTTDHITVNPAGAASFDVTAPASTTAGDGFSVGVTAKDAYGNVATGYTGTVRFSGGGTGASLPGDSTLTNGAGTFTGVTLYQAGGQTITAADSAHSTVNGQAGITVNPAAASKLAVTGFPTTTTAGDAHDVTVTAYDPYNNVATGYTGTIHFTSTDTNTQTVLPGDYTFTSGDSGAHTFSGGATLTHAGSQSITATDTSTAITGTQSGITVNPAAASQFVWSGVPNSVTAGSPFTMTLTAKDPYNNVATGYTGSVSFSTSDTYTPTGMPSAYQFNTVDAGTHTFDTGFTLYTVGTSGYQTIMAADSVNKITQTTDHITVVAAAADHFLVAGYPASTVAGTPHDVTVTALDHYGNTDTAYGGTVHISSTDVQARLPDDGTLTNGSGDFSVSLKTVGTWSITATDTSTAITGTQSGITVTPAAASQFVWSGVPNSTTAGSSFSPTLTAKDPYGNVDTNYTGTVSFSSTDPYTSGATLPSAYQFTSGSGKDNGSHTFNSGFTLYTASQTGWTITATDGTISKATAAIPVNPAAAASFKLGTVSSPQTAGAPFSATVTAYDAYGNIATGYAGPASLSDTSTTISPITTGAFTGGAWTGNVTVTKSGNDAITASDGAKTGTSNTFTVNAAAASTLTVSGYPSPTTAGDSHSFTVTAYDKYSNIATGYTGTVHFTSSDGQAGLPANYGFTSTDAGAHTFNATLKTAGTQSITATDTGTSTITGTQSGILVNPAALDHFVIGTIGTQTAGTAFNITITAKDAYGNTVTAFSGSSATVSISVDTGAIQPSTSGAFTNGVRTESVTVNTAGQRTISVTDGATPNAHIGQSNQFTVNQASTSPLLTFGSGAQPSTPSVTVQYSDPITVNATISPELPGNPDTGTVTFSTEPSGSSTWTQFGSAAIDGTGLASLTKPVMLAPGTYNVKVVFTSTNASYTNVTQTFSGALTVTQEDARSYYTGNNLFWGATTTSTSATVTLSATIKDITAVDPTLSAPNPDNYPGDISTATVTFVNRDSNNAPLAGCSNLPVTLVSSSDSTVGTTQCSTSLSIGNSGGTAYTIGIVVSGNYTRNQSSDDTTVTVAQPLTSNFITGGGYIVNSASAGPYAGDSGAKTNFGFNVKYNKGGTNLQGNANIIIRQGSHVYQIKSNSMTSLGVKAATSSSPATANFVSKANLQDVTNPNNVVSLGGYYTLTMNMTDYGSPGTNDTISFALTDPTGKLMYSSNWNGTSTALQILGGGNLSVH